MYLLRWGADNKNKGMMLRLKKRHFLHAKLNVKSFHRKKEKDLVLTHSYFPHLDPRGKAFSQVLLTKAKQKALHMQLRSGLHQRPQMARKTIHERTCCDSFQLAWITSHCFKGLALPLMCFMKHSGFIPLLLKSDVSECACIYNRAI